jgi:DNA-directed RNA polymerase specialized sigma24 family protein
MPDQELQDLLDRAAHGCEEARAQLVRNNTEYLLRAIRRRLKLIPRLRDLFDSTDILQETWQTFFTKLLEGRKFADGRALLTYLRRIAEYYLLHYSRKYIRAPKRDLRRQRPLVAAASVPDPHRPPWLAAAVREQWQCLVTGCDETHRLILEMLRDGCMIQETADALDACPRTIRRFLDHLHEKIEGPG